jgi:hypothetical protein
MPPQERLIYFNDARHFYLFVHEPSSMTAALAAAPVDEVAGCGVTTFSYGVNRSERSPRCMPEFMGHKTFINTTHASASAAVSKFGTNCSIGDGVNARCNRCR